MRSRVGGFIQTVSRPPKPDERITYLARLAPPTLLRGSEFSYGMNRRRLHYGLVLDGSRARDVLGYIPENPVDWPVGGPARPRTPDAVY